MAKSTSTGFYLTGAGAAGFGACASLNSVAPTVQVTKRKGANSFDPANFVDFEFKSLAVL